MFSSILSNPVPSHLIPFYTILITPDNLSSIYQPRVPVKTEVRLCFSSAQNPSVAVHCTWKKSKILITASKAPCNLIPLIPFLPHFLILSPSLISYQVYEAISFSDANRLDITLGPLHLLFFYLNFFFIQKIA